MIEEVDNFSRGQHITLVSVSILSCLLSTIGSTCIVIIIYLDKQNSAGNKMYHRLLLGLSLSDICNSVRGMFAPFLLPADTPYAIGAIGNQATCNFLGFGSQLGFVAPLYNASLATYFFLVVRRSKRGAATKGVEITMHTLSILYPLITAIYGLMADLYNPLLYGVGCWIAPYPRGCLEHDTIECTRGENADEMLLILGGVPVWFALTVITVSMFGLFISIQRQSQVVQMRHGVVANQNSSERSREHVKQTGIQATLYVVAFVFSYLWTGLLRNFEKQGKGPDDIFPMSVLSHFFFYLQGMWNFLIYIRPRFVDLRKKHPEESRLHLLLRIIDGKDVRYGKKVGTSTVGNSSLGGLDSDQRNQNETTNTFPERPSASTIPTSDSSEIFEFAKQVRHSSTPDETADSFRQVDSDSHDGYLAKDIGVWSRNGVLSDGNQAPRKPHSCARIVDSSGSVASLHSENSCLSLHSIPED